MFNLSKFSDNETARTCEPCSYQRAENLSLLGVKSVLELCVGPSLRQLERAYGEFNITVTGNDIDSRWKDYHPTGKWIIGDATSIQTSSFDAVVVAPPLSRNCSGRREDSLSLDQVNPRYEQFLNLKNKIIVFVLPGRTLSLKEDKKQLYKFLSKLNGKVSVLPLKDKVTKYVDVYLERE